VSLTGDTYDPVGDEQCCYPVGKARNSDNATFKRRKIGGIAFILTLVYVIMHRRISSLSLLLLIVIY
jgi:hypothetical protein